jgi:chromosome partitioning protein
MSKVKIFSISMNKGGVGKTSVITNLAAALSAKEPGKQILVIDTDGQGNASLAFGRNPNDFKTTMYNVMLGECTIEDIVISIRDNLYLAPSNNDMNFLDFDILTNLDKYKQPFALLNPAVTKIANKYDYIFIDTPPSLGLVSGNVLATTEYIIIPFVPELFAVQGLIRVIETIEDFKQKKNPALELFGVLGMMVDSRTNLHTEMMQKARKYCDAKKIKVFDTVINRSIRFASASAYDGKPAVWADTSNYIVTAYFELLDEILEGVDKYER